jgi:hypothetical protein
VLFVGQSGAAEDVCVCNEVAPCASMSRWAQSEPAFCSRGRFGQMLVDQLCREEWESVEETEICGTEQSLLRWAKKYLVHVFDPVLEMRDGVHIVGSVLHCGRDVGVIVGHGRGFRWGLWA